MADDLTTDEKLVVLIEECGEIIQAATKCLRFGFDRNQPDYGRNDKMLAVEIGELLGIADSLPLDVELIGNARATKVARVLFNKAQFGRVK
jgi:hypothetical protein